jgi:FkbM family methyltransferase
MLRDKLINTAMKLGIDNQLLSIRAMLLPRYRHDRVENENLRKLLESVLNEDSNCIDIGAYRGRVLAELVRIAPCGKHIAYEPLPHLHRYLVEHFPSVDVRQAAVSNEVGEVSYAYVKNIPAESGFRARAHSERQHIERLVVRTEMLDCCLPAGYVPALIKIDVEGAERQVFEGAIETISRYKPVIIFEHGKGGATYYDTRPSDIYQLLHEEAGLRIFDLDGNGPYTLSMLEETFALDERWDYVARPS